MLSLQQIEMNEHWCTSLAHYWQQQKLINADQQKDKTNWMLRQAVLS